MAIEVRTAADLNNVRNDLAAEYIQMADINAGSISPIGSYGSPFTGQYDGNGRTITNLSVSGGSGTGLFSALSGNGILKNIKITGATVTASGITAGILLGYYLNPSAGSYIYNCSVTGTISGTYDCALFVGNVGDAASGVKIEKCAAVGSVSSASPGGRVCGFAGDNKSPITNYAHFKDCYVRASLTVPNDNGWCGGFTGRSSPNSANSKFENCYAACTITGAGNTILLLGGFDSHDIYTPSIINCYYDYSLWPYQVPEEGGTPRTTAQMTHPESFSNTYVGWDFADVWRSDSLYTFNAGYPYFSAFRIWVKKSSVPWPERMSRLWPSWEPVTDIWVYRDFAWQPVTAVWVKKSGEWQSI